MAQVVQMKSGCGECIDGEVTLFFAHYSLKRLREDYIYCHVCQPDSKATAGPRAGEEQIDIDEYYKLVEAGWSEFNPV